MSIATRQRGIDAIRRRIDDHLDRAEDLELFGDHWWRVSKYAWFAAANVHRHAARELATILHEIEIGIYAQELER